MLEILKSPFMLQILIHGNFKKRLYAIIQIFIFQFFQFSKNLNFYMIIIINKYKLLNKITMKKLNLAKFNFTRLISQA